MRCLLSLNGLCDINLKEIDHDIAIGVDGGTAHLINAGISPDIVIGDFDSFKEKLQGVEELRFPADKDEIDAELALLECFKRGGTGATVTCWRGERADMEYALYLLLTRFPPMSVKLVAKKLIVFHVRGQMNLEANPGEVWSVLPVLGDAVVTLKGFKYEARDRVMPAWKPYGVSNVALERKVFLDVREGGVLVFRWVKKPL